MSISSDVMSFTDVAAYCNTERKSNLFTLFQVTDINKNARESKLTSIITVYILPIITKAKHDFLVIITTFGL